MDNNGNDPNAGAAGAGNLGDPNAGNQGGDPAQPSGNPDGQGGTQTNPGDAEKENLKREIQNLNKALVESRRKSNPSNNPNGNPNDGNNPFGEVAQQYGMALQVATNQLRTHMEDIFDLYPEIPATEIARVRKNPWAYASETSFLNGDTEAAALEIEQVLANRADEIGAGKGNPQRQPGTDQPASVNANPAPEAPPSDATPGSEEDENPYTMPMAKLEKLKNKKVAELGKKS